MSVRVSSRPTSVQEVRVGDQQGPYGSMGALDCPVSTHEFDASFMYAWAHGSAMAISFSPAHAPGSLIQVIAS
jgi:hypothetical protein